MEVKHLVADPLCEGMSHEVVLLRDTRGLPMTDEELLQMRADAWRVTRWGERDPVKVTDDALAALAVARVGTACHNRHDTKGEVATGRQHVLEAQLAGHWVRVAFVDYDGALRALWF